MAAVARAEPLFSDVEFSYQTGDGLIMATAVGAGVQNLDQVQVYLREVENRTSQFPYMFTIFVGQDGRRFMDEKRTAQTWNQEIKDDVVDLYGRTGVDYFWSLADEASLEMMQIADAAKDHEGVVVADTLDELAQKTGIDAEALKATVDRWNSFAAKMEDEDYGRTAQFWFPISTGPYYALKTTFFSSVCHGGITKNQNAQVTRIDGQRHRRLVCCGRSHNRNQFQRLYHFQRDDLWKNRGAARRGFLKRRNNFQAVLTIRSVTESEKGIS